MSARRGRPFWRLLLLASGAAVLIAVLWWVGWDPLAEGLRRVGWWFPALLAVYALPEAAFVEGWRQVLSPRPAAGFLPALAGPYLAGDMANYLGAGVAGEPLRSLLVGDRFGAAAAFASVNLRKHAELLAQVVFLVAGLTVSLTLFRIPAALAAAAVAGVATIAAGLVLMTWGLRRGSYSPILRRLAGWKALAARLSSFEGPAADADAGIRAFYGEHPARFAASAALAFVGWCGGLFETWLILRLLGSEAGWPEAWAIETLTMTLNTMLLFVPGRLGSAEAVRTGVFVALGLPAAAGAAYALVKRGREVGWLVPGAVYILRRHAGRFLRGGEEAPR